MELCAVAPLYDTYKKTLKMKIPFGIAEVGQDTMFFSLQTSDHIVTYSAGKVFKVQQEKQEQDILK